MAKRRGRGEGSISRRGDGRWQARVDLGCQNGKRTRKYYYGATRAEVAAKLARALGKVQQSLPLPAERQTVAQYLTFWLTHSAQTRLQPRTFASYCQVIRTHIAPLLGHRPLAKLSPEHVQQWLNERHASGLSARTCQYARAILRSALAQALKWNLVGRNVAQLVDPPASQKHEITPFDVDQARTLLATTSGHRLAALFSVAVAMGLRLGEALGLRWEDVNFEDGVLRLRVALQRIDGALVLTDVKSRRSRRGLVMPATVLAALKTHRVRQLEQRLAAGDRWSDTGLVFTTRHGKALDARNVSRQFHKILTAAGLPSIRFHDLRHTAASLLLAQGVEPLTIMEILGHSQVSLTLDTYTHVMPTLQRDAAAKMDAILKG